MGKYLDILDAADREKRKFVFSCLGCRAETRIKHKMLWEGASELLGMDGWRIVNFVRGEQRAWALCCTQCTAAVLQDRVAGAV